MDTFHIIVLFSVLFTECQRVVLLNAFFATCVHKSVNVTSLVCVAVEYLSISEMSCMQVSVYVLVSVLLRLYLCLCQS